MAQARGGGQRLQHLEAPREAVPRDLLEVALDGEARGHVEGGQLARGLEEEAAHLGDAHRARQRLRVVGEHRRHLRRALDVELLRVEAQPLRLVHLLAGADAEQHVVGLVVLAAEVVRVVGGHEGQARLSVEPVESLVHPPLLLDPVVHHLQEEPLAAEDVAQDAHRLQRGRLLAGADVLRHLAREAAGEPDQPLGVRGQHVLVDAGPVVEALRVADGHELHEVVVARLVLGQERQVVVGLLDAGPRLVVAAARGHVDLAAEDGLDALVEAGVVEGDRSEHVAVVGDGHRLHAEPSHLVHHLVDVAGPVEQAVLGVEVEVDELAAVAHGPSAYSSLCPPAPRTWIRRR